MSANLKIGIDFDNTIICYEDVFSNLAKEWGVISKDFKGTKKELRDIIRTIPDGEYIWQKMQGKVYGELIKNATIFPGFKEFMICCNANPTIEVYIISHKTQVGHFSEKNVNLREVAREWLQNQGFFAGGNPYILKENIFFEETRNDKIKRIKNLNCTHFIDDLIEVFDSTLFPSHIKRYLFQGKSSHSIRSFANWTEIKNAFFIE